jgi:selenide,water dikinase
VATSSRRGRGACTIEPRVATADIDAVTMVISSVAEADRRPNEANRFERKQRMDTTAGVRLTSFSHGGGCGCKIAPGVLAEILKGARAPIVPPELLVGIESGDDAAVYKLDENRALVATTDFFMPIVDDPYDFGRIAATNALSDVYAMGGTPIMALALVGMPIDKLPLEVIRRILEGGESACRDARIPIAGGHTIDSVEPIYGLVALGVVRPDNVKTNRGARIGDKLILGKPLGVGVLSAAVKQNRIDADGYRELVATTTKLNTPGPLLSELSAVHAMTDVTGFGLLGHLLPLCRSAEVSATLSMDRIPLLPRAESMAAERLVTGASGRNWASYGEEVALGPTITAARKALLTDPQTSGGLLVACAPEAVDDVLSIFRREAFDRAAVIGELDQGPPRVTVA